MKIKLICQPEKEYPSMMAFCRENEDYSIGIDGIINDAPQFIQSITIDKKRRGPFANLDHHYKVDRYSTRTASEQACFDLQEGLYSAFQVKGEPRVNLLFQNPDPDVGFTIYAFKNPKAIQELNDGKHEKLRMLYEMEGKIDTTCFSHRFLPNELPLLEELAWIIEPYTLFKTSDEANQKNPNANIEVILEMEKRIDLAIRNQGKAIPLNFTYKILDKHISSGLEWIIVEAIGGQAYNGIYNDGHNAFLAVTPLQNNRYKYSIIKKSPYIPFPLHTIYDALNKAEGNQIDLWGGSDTCGGGPRDKGSRLTPTEVAHIINNVLNALAAE